MYSVTGRLRLADRMRDLKETLQNTNFSQVNLLNFSSQFILSGRINLLDNQRSSKESHRHALLIFYTVATVLILVAGVIGNTLCLCKMIRQRMVRQSSAQFFLVFCTFDILVLLFYVLPDWLDRGVYTLTRADSLRWTSQPGVCQLFLLLSYWMRLVSVWALAAYSVDRYLGLKNPRYRTVLCGERHYNVKVITLVTLASFLVSLWKPYLSQSMSQGMNDKPLCGSALGSRRANVIYDTVYALLVSVLPSVVIVVANVAIAKRIYSYSVFSRAANADPNADPSTPATPSTPRTSQQRQLSAQVSRNMRTRQDLLAFQFAALLVVISSTFIFLSWPFFIVWLYSTWHTLHFSSTDATPTTSITLNRNRIVSLNLCFRLLFYMHFALNFFLYSIVSSYFKARIKKEFSLKSLRKKADEFYRQPQ